MSIRPAPARHLNRHGRSSPDRERARADVHARDYDRERDLPKLLPLWPWEVKALNRAGHMRLLARLRTALRVERQRGLGGHWTYDLARHIQLVRAYRAETAAYLRSTCTHARSCCEEHEQRRREHGASP